MLYELVKIFKGKEEVIMIGELAKINDRKNKARSSERSGIKGQRTAYLVRPSQTNEKYKKSPNKMDLSGDSYKTPREHGWS